MLNRFKNNSLKTSDRLSRSSFTLRLDNIKVFLTLGLLSVVLPGCTIGQSNATVLGMSPPIQSATTLEDAVDDPNEVVGQIVTVDGEVGEVVGSDSFIIKHNKLLGSDQVLVIESDPEIQLVEGNWVRVTGEVRSVVVSESEERDLNVEDEQEAVIVAESVELLAVD
ncbi:MAG TPA: hypothetical protein DD379_00065 [Cyanobacteria bacterium UBA11162]|nr:hypothetical protein [Cyanobacteria bacterium UBA11162]